MVDSFGACCGPVDGDEPLISEQHLEFAWRKHNLSSPWILCEGVDSTQDELRRRIDGSTPDGTVLLAESQTAGRGRFGKHWESPPGNLYLSVFLRPDRPAEEASYWTIAAGLASFDALTDAGVQPCLIKWPNDVWTNRGKLAGVLIEGKTRDKRWLETVVGWGVNVGRTVSMDELQVPVTSLTDETQWAWDAASLASLAAGFVRSLLHRNHQLHSGNWNAILEDWAACPNLYQGRKLQTAAGIGIARGLDEQGRLRVRLETGILVVLDDGDAVHTVE